MFETLLLIQVFCVLLTDVAGAPDEFLLPLFKRITGTKIGYLPKPWSCSLCQTWWLGLLYLLLTHQVTVPSITLLLLVACLTPLTLALYHLVVDFIMKMINALYDYFNL